MVSISHFQSNCINKLPGFATYFTRLRNKIRRSDKGMLILLFECSPNWIFLLAGVTTGLYGIRWELRSANRRLLRIEDTTVGTHTSLRGSWT